MKPLITILAFLLYSICVKSQSYNNVLADEEINQFMVEVLTRKESYWSIFNKRPKRIYFKPIHIGKANWQLSESKNCDFEIVFDKLYHRSDLSKEDLEYMRSQYVSIVETTWNFNYKKLKLRKRHRGGAF